MNHAPHLYFAWQQLVKKASWCRLATEEQWDELIASEMAYVNAVQEIAHLTEELTHPPRCRSSSARCCA